jgi:hypothetical protein
MDIDEQPPFQYSRFRVSGLETFREPGSSLGKGQVPVDRRSSVHSQSSGSTYVEAPIDEQTSQSEDSSAKDEIITSIAPPIGDREIVRRESKALRVEDLCN